MTKRHCFLCWGGGKVIKVLKTLKPDDFSETGLWTASTDTLQMQTKPYPLSKTTVVSLLEKEKENKTPQILHQDKQKTKNQPPKNYTKQNKAKKNSSL